MKSFPAAAFIFRYFHGMKLEQRLDHERLTRMCFIDYNRQMALLGLVGSSAPEIAGVGRLVKTHMADEAEIAVSSAGLGSS